jgi:hypothetical protein
MFLCSGRMEDPVAWKCPPRGSPASPRFSATPLELNLHHFTDEVSK